MVTWAIIPNSVWNFSGPKTTKKIQPTLKAVHLIIDTVLGMLEGSLGPLRTTAAACVSLTKKGRAIG